MARRFGWTEAQLRHLGDAQHFDDFTPAEKVALKYAEVVTRDSHHISERLWHQLQKHYSEEQIVELTAAIGLFNYFNFFNNALRMEPTK